MRLDAYISAIKSEENFILSKALTYIEKAKYIQYTSIKEKDWQSVVKAFIQHLITYLGSNITPEPIQADDKLSGNPAALFGIFEAKKFREQNIQLEIFLGAIKLIKTAFIDLIDDKVLLEEKKQALTITERFFDKFELGFSSEWASNLNITARKQIEEKLKESEKKFRNLAEKLPNMIFINKMGRIIYVNQICEKIMGYKVEEFYSNEFSFFKLIAPESIEKIKESFRKHQKGIDLLPYEYKIITKGGQKINVIISTKLIDFEGEHAILGIVTDISERKQMEESIKQTKKELEIQNEELKKIDKMKDSLVRDVSHELKTPVAKQKMQTDLLRRVLTKQGIIDKCQDILNRMDNSILRQERVINNILDLSRLESGGRKYQIKPIRLDLILEAVMKDYHFMFEAHDVIFEKVLSPVTIDSDQEMLFHVFSNLINNSIKYRNQSVKPCIGIFLKIEENKAIVKIIDNGIGLTKEEKSHIFKRFYQGSASSEGCGVGLAIVKMIVDDLKGNVYLESEGRNKGVTAVVELPMVIK